MASDGVVAAVFSAMANGAWDLVFPQRCAGCGEAGPSPCRACVDRLTPLADIEVGGHVDCGLAVLDYDDLTRRFVAALKYRGSRTTVGWFAEALVMRVADAGECPDMVTWIPGSPANVRRRGFDQAQCLATPVARAIGVPLERTLRRTGGGVQTGRERIARLVGPSLQPVRRGGALSGTVLLIDDVSTTGATLRSGAEVLVAQGAQRVVGLVVAHRRWCSEIDVAATGGGETLLKADQHMTNR